MLKPPEEHTTGSDEVPLGLVACCVGVEVPAAMYRREVSVCVDGHQRTQATGLPAIGCCFLFLSAATRHTDAWQRARVQAGSSTQSSDYRDAGSSTSSCESAPSSSCAVLLAAESQLVGFGAAIGRRYDAAARHQCGLLHAAPHGLLASRIGLGFRGHRHGESTR